MNGSLFRKLTPEESKSIYERIAKQTNLELFQSELVRSLYLVAILFAYRIATDQTEPSLLVNVVTVLVSYAFILFFSCILALIERRIAMRKLKGMKKK